MSSQNHRLHYIPGVWLAKETLKNLKKLLKPHPKIKDEPLSESSFPFKIGSKITAEEYNNFLQRKESSGYKYEHKTNGDVYVIDMSDPEHGTIVEVLRDYFNIANGGVIRNKPIRVSGDEFHYNPTVMGQFIASDVIVKPNGNHVQQPIVPYPGPPPGDKNGNPHARIICEVANKQSIGNLRNKCQNWLNQVYVRYVLGIKLHEKRTTRDLQRRFYRSMTAMLFQQGVPGYITWDFGTHQLGRPTDNAYLSGCNAPNIPAFQITIPVNAVFWDPPTIPAAAGYFPVVPPTVTLCNFTIDLFEIQQEVLNQQEN
ncbi:uncharacterized protein OCT59_011853 [Rhizophagus irregularis]|uniref:Restriction endonuclease domain-containing protein n=1 Tax=Rhizophagus irregularis TaxID=588596 RepID=A0A915ZJF9_9GLOM|nr:hypothetical protein OCT59_011853 [Rhizophagus irregularis]GBC39523.2 hypothetical protein GLOIN_2v1789506 [Rhizophagus irregularis DAOM 181602=DAOM 197198]CAB4489850.1 unnamed protein product [Rhizophagus irregularis]CAB5204421.1 unnamed protein product [Rhizophagus irregularis]CAB5377434.1 unnamed protein product [Rhizophagus irregularis]